MKQDSKAYQEKKSSFAKMLTVFGRNPVLEALNNPNVEVFRLHLADSNRRSTSIDEIIRLAQKKNAEVLYHSRAELSRISKNQKQDQGVAADLKTTGISDFESFTAKQLDSFELIALDRITNPQNLGMIIRSVCASPATGILLPMQGCAKLDPLVIKASAGTLFKATIIRCKDLAESLNTLHKGGADIIGLDVNAPQHIHNIKNNKRRVWVLGNETEGLSQKVQDCCTESACITMHNGVESLNVAVTASIIAFRNA